MEVTLSEKVLTKLELASTQKAAFARRALAALSQSPPKK